MRAAGLLLTLPVAACVREPAEALCPQLADGELVVTEVRGTQSPKDTAGPWIELYNAGNRTIDLMGLSLQFRRLTNVPAGGLLVRRSLLAEPGGYTVLGLFEDTNAPPHIDYGFLGDFAAKDHPAWEDDAALAVLACGALIETVSYRLPKMGSYSLGGAPDADRNDDPNLWCTDLTQVGLAFPGTPGKPNIACP